MPTATIKPNVLGTMLRKEDRRVAAACKKAARAAARRFLAHLVRVTDDLGITDRGIYKAGFKVVGNSVTNDAPHAGIIELGARPHPVSQEGRDAIAAWAMRKLGVDAKAAKSIAWVVAQRIAKEGQAPRYVMRNELPHARQFFAEEVVRLLEGSS